jgi:hypothetical protein
VATHLACEESWAPAEAHARVLHLDRLKRDPRAAPDFEYCDHVTSGYAAGFCAGHGARIAQARRDAAIAALTAAWTPAEKAALTRLRIAAEAYAEAHAQGEVDGSGTLRIALWIEAQQEVLDEMLARLRRLEAGGVTWGDFRSADARLNADYRKVMNAPASETQFWGTISKEGIRDAQRAWLRYRDAFLALAAVRYPQANRDALAAFLTAERIRKLHGLEE